MSTDTTDKKAKVTTSGDREVVIERVFDAPRDRVYAAFTDPELIPQWWGRYEDTTTVDKLDVTPGGEWRFVTESSKDGEKHAFRGAFREVVPPERIVWTFEWEGMKGYVSVETVAFEDLGEQTRVTSTSLFFTTEERDGMLESGMEKGLNETYARLDELLAKTDSGHDNKGKAS
jgi:uncharacterized protein YndB with AHSA1/START domain